LRAIGESATRSVSRLDLARACVDAGLLAEAREELLAAVDESPDDPSVYFELLSLARHGGGLEECRTRLATWADGGGEGAGPAACALGSLAESEGRFDDAERRYRAALPCARVRSIALNNLAWLLGARLGRVSEALPLARAASEASPLDAEIADTLGHLLHLAGEHADAWKRLDRAVALAPERVSFLLHRADASAALDRFDAALADYDRALALDPAPTTRTDVYARRAKVDARRVRARESQAARAPPSDERTEGDARAQGE
jgi:tetratricopeptide (TPR) repeat protein